MKRLVSILLLGILCFNWFGYRLFSSLLQQQANTALEARLDQHDYDESQLIEIRVSLNLPYQTDWTDFERVDGETEINGIHYKYVKRKVEKGQLILLCLPNETKMRLQTARDDFFRLVNDLQHPSQGKQPDNNYSISFNILSEYWQEKNDWELIAFSTRHLQHSARHASYKTSNLHFIPDQPPELPHTI